VFVDAPRFTPKATGGDVVGQVKNTGTGPLSGVLRARLVDAAGRTVGNADGLVSDVQPGDSRVYVLTTGQVTSSIARIVPQVVVSRPGNAAARLEIKDITVKTGQNGDTVVGQIHNSDESMYAVALVAGFVDDQGNLSGAARGIVGALEAGQTQPFTLTARDQATSTDHVVVQVAT